MDSSRFTELKEHARDIRINILKMIHKAQSGHPGGSLSASDIMAALYFDQLNIRPGEPGWTERDRFVLSKGHACPVWYAALALRGYFDVSVLNTLRKFESPLQGHPVAGKCPGVDATAGSLGVGLAEAVGMALEARLLKKGYQVYALCGDGELQEGIIWESANAAARFKLDNLVVIIDNNGLQNDGYSRDVMPMEPIEDKFRAFRWETARINGHSMEDLIPALEKARAHEGSPYCIVAETVKGKGVSFMEDIRGWHGKAPDDEQLNAALKEITEGRA